MKVKLLVEAFGKGLYRGVVKAYQRGFCDEEEGIATATTRWFRHDEPSVDERLDGAIEELLSLYKWPDFGERAVSIEHREYKH